MPYNTIYNNLVNNLNLDNYRQDLLRTLDIQDPRERPQITTRRETWIRYITCRHHLNFSRRYLLKVSERIALERLMWEAANTKDLVPNLNPEALDEE